MSPPIPKAISAYLGIAFEASVRSVSNEPTTQLPGNAPFSWEVTLDISSVYRGSVPSVLVVNGWRAGCHWFRGEGVESGDTLLFSMKRLQLPTLGSNILAWRKGATGWRFDYEAILPDTGNEGGVFPAEAEKATTKAEILALVAPSDLPSTDGAWPGSRSDDTSVPPKLIVLFGAVVWLWLVVRRPRLSN